MALRSFSDEESHRDDLMKLNTLEIVLQVVQYEAKLHNVALNAKIEAFLPLRNPLEQPIIIIIDYHRQWWGNFSNPLFDQKY